MSNAMALQAGNKAYWHGYHMAEADIYHYGKGYAENRWAYGSFSRTAVEHGYRDRVFGRRRRAAR